jgi:hypothetical protein
VARAIANRLKADGVRVWFDEWELKPGDHIHAKVEAGLEASRVLVLCMSANAFGADWTQLEAGMFRFRDPLNKERRFVAVIGRWLRFFMSIGTWRRASGNMRSCSRLREVLFPEIQLTLNMMPCRPRAHSREG